MRAYDARKQMMVAQYQYGLFRSELKQQKAKYENWKANQKGRAERAGLNYLTYEELYNDYIIGKLDERTFRWQRKLYNLIIADNWQRKEKIEWLEKECEKYRKKAESLEMYYEECNRREKQVYRKRHNNKVNGIRKHSYDWTKNRSVNNMPKHERAALKAKEQAAKEKKKNGE